jgi:HEAT repeat protein
MVSATSGMTGEADLREALFEIPGLRSATSASATEHVGNPDAAELADLTEHLDPLLLAAAAARDSRDYPRLAQALVQIHQLEDGGNDTHRAIVARERRRVVPSESLLAMARLVPKPETPAVIARALALLGTEGAAALIVMLSGAPPAHERRAYIAVLVDCHDCDDAVIAALGSTRSELVRDAAEVVGRKRLERAVPTLTNLLKRPQVEIRTAAWHALENIGTRDALKALHAHA